MSVCIKKVQWLLILVRYNINGKKLKPKCRKIKNSTRLVNICKWKYFKICFIGCM